MDNIDNTDNINNTDNTNEVVKEDHKCGIKPRLPELCYGVESTRYHLYGYDYDLNVERLTPPRFKAHLNKDDAGHLTIDRNNIYWYDTISEEERTEILDDIENNRLLDYMNKTDNTDN